jgi:hypothetical protein
MAGTMRPAFSTITINQKSLTVTGPIDFGEDEEAEAYFWVRVTKGETAEAIGTKEMDEKQTKKSAATATKQLEAVLHPHAQAGPVGPLTTPAQVQSISPMWTTTCRIKKGTFEDGDQVAIEAWALVRTKVPERTFHIYWEDKNFTIPAG